MTQQKSFDSETEIVTSGMFDIEELHENCTVRILRNSYTGEMSLGWWENK